MADTFSKEKRSWIMSRVKGKNTKPELTVRSFLHKHGFRYRLHANDLPGRPDIVLRKFQTVIFVHGCFWHGHKNCSKSNLPKTRIAFWEKKMLYNAERDLRNQKLLKKLGWEVIIIWQCKLKSKNSDKTLKKVIKKILIKRFLIP